MTEVGQITIYPNKQYTPGLNVDEEGKIYQLNFQQLNVYHKPTFREKDRVVHHPTPLDARLRNLTYEAELYMDVRYRIFK